MQAGQLRRRKRKRPHRCQPDLRVACDRFPAGVLHGLHAIREAARKRCGTATCWFADGAMKNKTSMLLMEAGRELHSSGCTRPGYFRETAGDEPDIDEGLFRCFDYAARWSPAENRNALVRSLERDRCD